MPRVYARGIQKVLTQFFPFPFHAQGSIYIFNNSIMWILKKKIKQIALDILFRTKFYNLYKHPLKILMYHRFMDDEDDGYVLKKSDFESQILFFKKHFSFYTLEGYVDLSGSEKKRVKNPIILTVDDGYLNFYRYALPILRKHSIPATMFIPFDFVENGGWLWQDKNIYIIRNARNDFYTFKWRGSTLNISKKSLSDLFKSLWLIYGTCIPLGVAEKEEFSEKLALQLDVVIPPKPVDEFAPLTWEQVREMKEEGISIGSHGMTHQILTELSEEESLYEICESKKMLEYRLGHEVRSFCYPSGYFNQRIIEQIKACKYKSAVTTKRGSGRDLNEMYTLKRIGPANGNSTFFLESIYLHALKVKWFF